MFVGTKRIFATFAILCTVSIAGLRAEDVLILSTQQDCFLANTHALQNKRDAILEDGDYEFLCEDAFSNASTIETLHLNHLNMWKIGPKAFAGATNLVELRLIGNQLTEIENDIFLGLPIEILDLSYNKLSKISHYAFKDMQYLKQIILSNNNIKRIKKSWFQNCPSLSHFQFDYNQINYVQKKVFKFFQAGRDEIRLDLSHNRIETIEKKAFLNFGEFGHVNLSYNSLKSLPHNLFGNIRIGKFYLNLEHNQLECFEFAIFVRLFANCRSVLLKDNPINCSCSSKIDRFNERRGNALLVYDSEKCRTS